MRWRGAEYDVHFQFCFRGSAWGGGGCSRLCVGIAMCVDVQLVFSFRAIQSFFLFGFQFFLSLIWKTQANHWTKRMVNT